MGSSRNHHETAATVEDLGTILAAIPATPLSWAQEPLDRKFCAPNLSDGFALLT